METKQSPLFSKTYDLLLWLLAHNDKFPKIERFRLAKRLEDTIFAIYNLFLDAAYIPDKQRSLRCADVELKRLLFYLRLCHSRKLLSLDQYRFAISQTLEIGRLLGGWLKASPLED